MCVKNIVHSYFGILHQFLGENFTSIGFFGRSTISATKLTSSIIVIGVTLKFNKINVNRHFISSIANFCPEINPIMLIQFNIIINLTDTVSWTSAESGISERMATFFFVRQKSIRIKFVWIWKLLRITM